VDHDLWLRAEELFHAALARPPESRSEFLNTACGEDDELRREVAELLSRDQRAGSFLESPLTADESLVGRRVGPYSVQSLVGVGGMGEVYRAHDSKLRRDVAIKVLPSALAHDADRLARFRREARTLASLNHPNIAAIYGLETCGDLDCLVLELVEGDTLRGPLPVGAALAAASQVAEALEAAHEKGIVHRDLKPANVKITPQGRVKVLDFGVAKAMWGGDEVQDLAEAPTATAITIAGHLVGTPGYMSPEQAIGKDVNRLTDIWAFGCLLYELLTGRRAFDGETVAQTIAAVRESEPDWTALSQKTPGRVRELLRGCLQKDASRRPQSISDVRAMIVESQRVPRSWITAGFALTAMAILVGIATNSLFSPFLPHRPSVQNQWTQLTNLTDSAVQPALSADGRVVAFIRGPGGGNLYGPGQIYVKTLPNGEAAQITNDETAKVSPVFSPDGSEIAWGTSDGYKWDTWIMPLAGGGARLWLPNSSGLAWLGPRQLLFSEIRGTGVKMALVSAHDGRIDQHDVYVPERETGMAHRSYPSPDHKWALVVEMAGPWLPCRIVPLDGQSSGRRVGPPSGACTFAAWSPDGKWMYFSSSVTGAFHTWRQRYPDGKPEQVTAGPTEEEGVAMSPDGRSFVTSVGVRQSPVWLHDARGERQISLEGYAYDPKFTPDGKKLLYRAGTATAPLRSGNEGTALRIADVESGRSEPLLGESSIYGLTYDVSPDGKRIVFQDRDHDGKWRLRVAALDRSSPPRQIPNVEGQNPVYGPTGEIFFQEHQDSPGLYYRVREDGTGLRRASGWRVGNPRGISPDGQWLVATVPAGHHPTTAFPLTEVAPITIWNTDAMQLKWSHDAKWLFMRVRTSYPWGGGRTYAVPLAAGHMFPLIPPDGFESETQLRKIPGVRIIDSYDMAPGPSPEVYAFSRETVQRNLYRVPVP
jgi:serine/threonine protein kinase